MKVFKDNKNREWIVAVNHTTVKRVQSILNVDLRLMQDEEAKLVQRLETDTILLVDVIFVICQPQAEKMGISDEEFGEAMAGDAIFHATEALIEEMTDFFPNPRHRGLIKTVLEKRRTVQSKVLDRAESVLGNIDLNKEAESLTRSLMKSLESPASTPVNTPSES